MPEQAAANLLALIESTEDLIWFAGLDFRLITFNGAFQRAFETGYGIQPVAGMLPNDLLPPERAAIFPPLYERALAEGPFRTEYTMRDGRTLDMAFNRIVIDGKAAGISVFGKDITERKQVLDSLREREARLNEAEHIALAGSSSWDIDSDTTTWSEGLYRITGWDPHGPGPTHAERRRLYTAESWTRREDAIKLTLETGGTYELDLQIVRPDGALRWTRARGSAVRNEQGRIHKLIGTLQDITDQKLVETKLRESEQRYRATFEQAAIGIVHTSFEGRVLRCNARFAEILNYSAEELNGVTVEQITAPEDRVESTDAIQRMTSGESLGTSFEKRYVHKDGSLKWVRVTSSVQRDSQGRQLHLETFVEDIDARKTAEMQLAAAEEASRASETHYRTVFQTSLDGIAISRLEDGKYIDVNPAFLKMMKFTLQEVIGHTSLELGAWTDPGIREEIVQVLRRDGFFRNLTIPYRRRNGETFWMQLSGSLMEVDGVPCIVSVTRDTSEIRAAEERIKDLALYDQLTRLPNRRLLLERLQGAQDKGAEDPRDRALLFIDLAEFKKVNDTLGLQTGDLLLQEVARRLTACVRGADTVARCGGDEFAVVLEDMGKIPEPAASHAQIVAEKIVAAIGQPYFLDGHECHCRCNIGIAIFGNVREGPDQILQQAELALHQAKRDGRNATRFFAPDLQAAADARAAIEEDLHQAIGRRQFELFYQPQVDSTGLIGAEALIRWNHPKRGLLAPDEFIHLAEETGLILPIGDWVLETACRQIAAWAQRPETSHIALAVNISARQLRQPEFVDQVLAMLLRTGANPRNLRLELTESMLLENIDDVIAKMSALKARGLRFSLDDFGTGYSSLAYLKRLPLDQLKIDRVFVRDILVDVTSGAIAQTIVSLSRAMSLSVIAEGVETEEQREFLVRLGCHAFQGYLFSRPLPLDDFEIWRASRGPLAPGPGSH